MAAVLVSLFVLGVGMRTYNLDVNDLTDVKNLSDKVGGFGDVDFSDRGSAGGTAISADFVSGGNVSDMVYRGDIRTLRVEGDEVDVDAGFSTTDTKVLVKNLSGTVRIEGGNLSVTGRTKYLVVGDREMRSEERGRIEISSEPSEVFVENVSGIDFSFDDVEGSLDLEAYSLSFESTPLELKSFTGSLEKNFDESSYVMKGVVKRGSVGPEGSRTVIGD